MYTTEEIMREMLEIGMIDKEEYDEAVAKYKSHVEALMAFDYMMKKVKEAIDNIKKEEINRKEYDPKYEKLCAAYMKDYISEEDFKKMSKKFC